MASSMEGIWIGFILVSISAVVSAAWVAYKSFLKLREQLEMTKAQLATKEEKEKEEQAKKLKIRRATILTQPIKAIAPPNTAFDEHPMQLEDVSGSDSAADNRGYLSQMGNPPYLTNINGPDIYHSVRPLDYWKHYQYHNEGATPDDQYQGYSRPHFANSELLTNPVTTQHSINWNKRYASPFYEHFYAPSLSFDHKIVDLKCNF